jgi:hypothetical protein
MNKGQTALEYLMTYGWAILIVIIVVSALYALGLAKPCRWVGTQIREFADFKVENPRVTTTGDISFDVSRIRPETVNVTAYYATIGTNSGSLAASDQMSSSVAPVRRTVSTGASLTSGDCYSATVAIQYDVTTAGGTVTYNSTGTISGIVA